MWDSQRQTGCEWRMLGKTTSSRSPYSMNSVIWGLTSFVATSRLQSEVSVAVKMSPAGVPCLTSRRCWNRSCPKHLPRQSETTSRNPGTQLPLRSRRTIVPAVGSGRPNTSSLSLSHGRRFFTPSSIIEGVAPGIEKRLPALAVAFDT